jgi:DNA-binding Lrp family transcriptional regulator
LTEENAKAVSDVELGIISELMKNGRMSDRDVARRLGFSQPTVSRMRHKLERDGYIRKYTIVPNWEKLGFQIVATTFVKFREDLSIEAKERLRKRAQDRFRDDSFASSIVMFERGMGLGYASYAELLRQIKRFTVLEPDIKSFLSDLNDRVHYRPMSFAPLAEYIQSSRKAKKEQ